PRLLLARGGGGGRLRKRRSQRGQRDHDSEGTRATGDHSPHGPASLRSGRGEPPDATRGPGRVVRDHPGRPPPCETATRRTRSPDGGRKLAGPPKAVKPRFFVKPAGPGYEPIAMIIKLGPDARARGIHPNSAPGGASRPVFGARRRPTAGFGG